MTHHNVSTAAVTAIAAMSAAVAAAVVVVLDEDGAFNKMKTMQYCNTHSKYTYMIIFDNTTHDEQYTTHYGMPCNTTQTSQTRNHIILQCNVNRMLK